MKHMKPCGRHSGSSRIQELEYEAAQEVALRPHRARYVEFAKLVLKAALQLYNVGRRISPEAYYAPV